MFLLAIATGMCAAYIFLFYTLPIFFARGGALLSYRVVYRLLALLVASAGTYAISFAITDSEVTNRFLHAIGGGVIASFTFYLAATDARVTLSTFQYAASSMLVVIALGVLNEHAEFALQTFTNGIYTTHLTDTWLDLTSNTVGALAGTSIFAMRIHKRPA